MNSNSLVFDKAYYLSKEIVETYQYLSSSKKEFVLSKQLLRCGTSIGANIAEANDGFSEKDFMFKMSVAYKECLETKYWLNLLKDTHYLPINMFDKLFSVSDEIAKMLYCLVRTSKRKQN